MGAGKLGAEKLETQYFSILSPLLRGSSIHNGISLSLVTLGKEVPKYEASCKLPKVMQEICARSRNKARIS